MFGPSVEDEEIRWVRITGLQSAAGQKLNGKIGHCLYTTKEDADGRFPIHIDGDTSKGKLLKPTNFVDIPPGELVKACRLPCRAERTVPEVLMIPKDHSLFQECDTMGNAPIPRIIGIPLQVTNKINPYRKLTNPGDARNQSAAALMIEPNSGFAPQGMEDNYGPALVYRPDGQDLGYADMVAMLDYQSKLIQHLYTEEKTGARGSDFDRHVWLNREYFQRVLREGEGKKYKLKDLNILL